MQTNYVVDKRIFLTAHSTYLERGDLLQLNDKTDNNLTIFRGGKIVATVTYSQTGISALKNAGIITPSTTTGVKTEATVVKAPTPPAQQVPSSSAAKLAALEAGIKAKLPNATKTLVTETDPDKMSKSDLLIYGVEAFGMQLNPTMTLDQLLTAIKTAAAAKAGGTFIPTTVAQTVLQAPATESETN